MPHRPRFRIAVAAALVVQATVAAVPAAAQNCAGGVRQSFQELYQGSDQRLREFLHGVWQGEGPDTVGNFRRSQYSFHFNGSFTRDETVCFRGTNACGPSQGQGAYAVYMAQQGIMSLALYENGNCSVSHLVISDRNTIFGANDPERRPLVRIR
jgi:hypothetical protein